MAVLDHASLKQIPILVNRWDSQGLMDERVYLL
jgi:hypothetical protein